MKPEPTEQDRQIAEGCVEFLDFEDFTAINPENTYKQIAQALATVRTEAATEAALSMRERAANALPFAIWTGSEDYAKIRAHNQVIASFKDKIRALPVEGVSDQDTLLQECRKTIQFLVESVEALDHAVADSIDEEEDTARCKALRADPLYDPFSDKDMGIRERLWGGRPEMFPSDILREARALIARLPEAKEEEQP